jgi:hypothetical protein
VFRQKPLFTAQSAFTNPDPLTPRIKDEKLKSGRSELFGFCVRHGPRRISE